MHQMPKGTGWAKKLEYPKRDQHHILRSIVLYNIVYTMYDLIYYMYIILYTIR